MQTVGGQREGRPSPCHFAVCQEKKLNPGQSQVTSERNFADVVEENFTDVVEETLLMSWKKGPMADQTTPVTGQQL